MYHFLSRRRQVAIVDPLGKNTHRIVIRSSTRRLPQKGHSEKKCWRPRHNLLYNINHVSRQFYQLNSIPQILCRVFLWSLWKISITVCCSTKDFALEALKWQDFQNWFPAQMYAFENDCGPVHISHKLVSLQNISLQQPKYTYIQTKKAQYQNSWVSNAMILIKPWFDSFFHVLDVI